MSTVMVDWKNVRAYLMCHKLTSVVKENGWDSIADFVTNANEDQLGHILQSHPEVIFKAWNIDEPENQLNADSVAEVNHVVKTERFTGYEFVTKEEVYVEEAGSEFSLFRLEIHAEGAVIMVANWDEYCVHEDVTHLFDVDSVRQLCEGKKDLSDHTEFYLDWLEEENE